MASELETHNSQSMQRFYQWSTLSEAVKANGFLFISGTVGMSPEGATPEDFKEQCRNSLVHIRQVIEASGGDPDRIVQFMTFSVDTGAPVFDDFRLIFDAKREIFPNARPAGTGIRVTALAQPELKVEIQVIVAL